MSEEARERHTTKQGREGGEGGGESGGRKVGGLRAAPLLKKRRKD